MPDFRITHALGSYAVRVQPGALDELPALVSRLWPTRRVAVITDDTVGALLADRLAAGPWALVLSVPAGESSKTRARWEALTDALFAAGFSRDSAIVALGGGMVGDLAGFVAATYARGIPFLHVPTTLLAMVDSSLGGKTGVDTAHGKNLVGAFHPPAAVLADPLVLRSLPPQHLRGGLAEMAKHGLIADAAYWHELGQSAAELKAREPVVLTRFIARSVEIKAAVVMEDEREGGRRAVLNAGHTVAHAVEHASGFGVPHGDAVAMGLVVEAHLAESVGVAVPGLAAEITAGLRRLSLPTRLSLELDANQLLEAMRLDKKRAGTELRFALPRDLGVMARDDERWTIAVRDPSAIVHALRSAGAA
ncbi:MAG TPA: 3-dehydroquinate synthase [Gemmatimonadales bacterium]|nr:3-dehydroquinate synthase [Gemmatimonadales bacterium]